jgi:GNAT superfamily N-acetyltransferase
VARVSEPRRATTADLPAIESVVRAAYRPYLGRMDRPPAPLEHDYRNDVGAGTIWVLGDPVAGLVSLVPDGAALLVENVAVSPTAQGTGLGRQLLEFAERYAAGHGHDRTALYTNEVMTENLAIYAHLGYRETGRRTEDGYRRVYLEKPVSPAGR